MTKADKLLIFLVFLVAIGTSFYFKNSVSTDGETYVSIQVEGKEVEKIIFDKAVVGRTMKIKTDYGFAEVEIGDGEVWLNSSTCPDQLCIKSGKISRSGEMLVCLPNKIVVEVKNNNDGNKIDIVNY